MSEIIFNTPGVKAISLREEHIDEIIELMNKEGWYYYDHQELKRYLDINQDCFSLLKDGRIIGSIFTTNYDNQAWIGNIIVAKEFRGMGLAVSLIKGVIKYLHQKKNIHTFRLGSVPLAIGLYKKIGFSAESFTTAQEAELPIKIEYEKINLPENIQVERLNTHDLVAISDIDKRYLKSNRLHFFTNIYNDSIKSSCFCLKDQENIVGFLMLRRRQDSKTKGDFAEGPDYAYRLGPSCVLPEYGVNGFKLLFQKAIQAVNEEVRQRGGSARIYAVFPRNADKNTIYNDTRELTKSMGLDTNIDLDNVFDQHDHIFDSQPSIKNEEQWKYMEFLGFHQEYFEQIMSYTFEEALNTHATKKKAEKTRADTEGIFASATPGDKA